MMSKIIEAPKLVNKLPKDDPECLYVNSMMEVSTDILRDMFSKSGENFDKMHGVVPKCNLPSGYDFGKLLSTSFKSSTNYKKEKYQNTNCQNLLNSASSLKMEIDDISNAEDKKTILSEMVSKSVRMSSDEEEIPENVRGHNNVIDVVQGDSERIFETLNKCSSLISTLSSVNIFKKHYGHNKSENIATESLHKNINRKDPPDDASCTGDTEPFEDSNESAKAKPQDVMRFIELLSSSKPEIKLSTFEPIYNEINRKRQAMKIKKQEDHAPPTKIIKYMVEKHESSMELTIRVLPELAKDFNLRAAVEAMKTVKPNYASQESLPFGKTEYSIKKDNKSNDKCSTSSNTQQLFSNTPSSNDPNAIKKPLAAAKQIFPHSNYGNSTKIAVVTGKINQAPTTLHNNNNTSGLSNQHNLFEASQQKSKPLIMKDPNQRIMNINEHEADEQKVVEGLKAIEKLRLSIKSDFINRMRDLKTEQWLIEADGHKESANNVQGKLEYPPMIIVAVRKYLIYNYSLDVKEQYKKCHETYIKNAEFVCQITKNLENVYKQHINEITDPNCPRLWNLKLIKWFTMTMCMKLSAILQYRAFRNVSSICKESYSWLRTNGILDKEGRTNTIMTENNQNNSPFSVLNAFSPCRNSARNSSPRGTTPANQRTIVNASGAISTLTPEMKAKLQYYIEYTGIINNSYNDWMRAEMNHVKFCEKSARHDEAWRKIEWKIIEKTGGITINGIDESMAFVIKYLEGFINYMNEFQKNLHPPRSSDSRLIS